MEATIETDGARVRLRGALSVETARALFERTPAALSDSADEVVIDLAEVTEADSAGLALLVHWSGNARARFTNAPAQLQRLAEINGLRALLD